MLLFVPNGAVMEVDGGKPTSRGLPPAAFWGTGRFGSMQTHTHPVSRGAAVPPAVGAGLTHPSPMSGVTGVLWRCVMGCGWMEMERDVRWHMEMWAQALPPQGWGVTQKRVFRRYFRRFSRRLPGGPRRLSSGFRVAFSDSFPAVFPMESPGDIPGGCGLFFRVFPGDR